MKCIGVKGHIHGQCSAVEVRSRHVSQQATHIVVEAVNVDHSFWAATSSTTTGLNEIQRGLKRLI